MSSHVRIDNVSKHFSAGHYHLSIGHFRNRSLVKAVDGVSFDIPRGETVGLVGESGSGKSTLGRMIVGLMPVSSGTINIDGHYLDGRRSRSLWRNTQMVFQDPSSSLNPRMTIRDTLAEPLRNFGIAKGAEAQKLIRSTIEYCGLSASALDRYPREYSGGQRQRIGIARALILRPKFIVADEPVSALDVSIQAQIINLMQDLKSEFGLTYLFIAHDLAVVRHVSDWLAVMYRGKLVEYGPAQEIYSSPSHPYTQLLIHSIPVADARREAERRRVLKASRVTGLNLGGGCPFLQRCPLAIERCAMEEPILLPAGGMRRVACHLSPGAGVVTPVKSLEAVAT